MPVVIGFLVVKYTQTSGQEFRPGSTSARTDDDQAQQLGRRRRVSASRPPAKASPGRSLQARPAVHTLEVKPDQREGFTSSPKQGYLELLSTRRLSVVSVAKQLYHRGIKDFDGKADLMDPLQKASARLWNCSLLGAFRSVSENVNYPIGKALCKNRLCPNCQAVLAAKRKRNFLEWFELNLETLRPYYFYHLVLTVRHRPGHRDGLYTGELLDYFAQLRGSGSGKKVSRHARAWWEAKVAGGTYSVETVQVSDTPHIHIHVLVVARRPLYRASRPSVFFKEASARWLKITGDSDCGVHIEPVYSLDADRNRIYQTKSMALGGSVQGIAAAVAECTKYTLKTEPDALARYEDDFLRDLLTKRHRYFGRFGILTKKHRMGTPFTELERLNTDFKDLERLSAEEAAGLLDVETGELVPTHRVPLVVTSFKNTTWHETAESSIDHTRGEAPRGAQQYFSINDPARATFYNAHEKQEVALHLAKSITKTYNKENDLYNHEVHAIQLGDAQDVADPAGVADIQTGVEGTPILAPGTQLGFGAGLTGTCSRVLVRAGKRPS